MLTIVPCWIVVFLMGINGTTYSYTNTENSAKVFLSAILVVGYLSFISSQIVIAILINKQGLGKETRGQILWRHTALVTTWCTCNLFLLFCIFTK